MGKEQNKNEIILQELNDSNVGDSDGYLGNMIEEMVALRDGHLTKMIEAKRVVTSHHCAFYSPYFVGSTQSLVGCYCYWVLKPNVDWFVKLFRL